MTKELNHWDQRIKTLMEQVGHPDSMSLYQAFKQLQNELTQRPQAVPMTRAQRLEAFRKAEDRMAHDINLCWRDALIEETEAHHGITQRADGGEVE